MTLEIFIKIIELLKGKHHILNGTEDSTPLTSRSFPLVNPGSKEERNMLN